MGMGLACFVFMATAGRSEASIVTYSDRAAFQAHAVGLSTIDFQGLATPSTAFINYGQGASLSTGGVTFTANGSSDLFANGADTYQAQYGSPFNLGEGDFLQAGNGSPAGLSIALPGGVTALGFLLETFDSPTSGVTITLSTGDVVTIAAPAGGVTFFGFTSTVAVTALSAEITAGDRMDTLSIDTVQYGAAVPEPAGLALLASGVLPIACLVLRGRRALRPVA
ncbi:hypothetical protein [Aquisphaera giovannonii]|nr:hypothetical protein [Aquisphaera giovannonii]